MMLSRAWGALFLVCFVTGGTLPRAWAQEPAANVAPAAAPSAANNAAASDKSGQKSGEEEGKGAIRRKPFDSMMFAVDEFNEIQSRIASGTTTATNQGRQAIEDASLYLSTIVYYGPKDWTIWVNGVPIGPDQDFQAFQVTDIQPSSVELLVPLSAQGMRPVRLSPNQTFITRTGLVVEGRAE